MLFSKKNRLYSPVDGEFIPLKEVNDPVFAQGMMGDGVAVIPENNQIFSPVEGIVTMTSDQKHGIGIKMLDGTEFLLHMGIDTVELNGGPFETKVKVGDSVKVGDILSLMDLESINKAGKETVIMMVVIGKTLSKVQYSSKRQVKAKDELAKL